MLITFFAFLLLVPSLYACGKRVPVRDGDAETTAPEAVTEEERQLTPNGLLGAAGFVNNQKPAPEPEVQPTEMELFLQMSEAERALYLIGKASPEEYCATEYFTMEYRAAGTEISAAQNGTVQSFLPCDGQDGYYRYDRTLTLQEADGTATVIEKKDGYFNQTALYYRANGENKTALCAYAPEEQYWNFRKAQHFAVAVAADVLTCTKTEDGFRVTVSQMHETARAAILEQLNGTWGAACRGVKDIMLTLDADSALQVRSVEMYFVYDTEGAASFSYKKDFAPVDRNAAETPKLDGYTYVSSLDDIAEKSAAEANPANEIAEFLHAAKSETLLSFHYDSMTKFYRNGKIHSFRTEKHDLSLSALAYSPVFYTACVINNIEEIRKYEDGKLKTIRNEKVFNAEPMDESAVLALIESYIDCGGIASMDPYFAYAAGGVYTVRFVPDAAFLADKMRMAQEAVTAEDLIAIKGTAYYTVDENGKLSAYYYQIEADFQKDEGTVGVIYRLQASDFDAS